jgi:hypothetical protein
MPLAEAEPEGWLKALAAAGEQLRGRGGFAEDQTFRVTEASYTTSATSGPSALPSGRPPRIPSGGRPILSEATCSGPPSLIPASDMQHWDPFRSHEPSGGTGFGPKPRTGKEAVDWPLGPQASAQAGGRQQEGLRHVDPGVDLAELFADIPGASAPSLRHHDLPHGQHSRSRSDIGPSSSLKDRWGGGAPGAFASDSGQGGQSSGGGGGSRASSGGGAAEGSGGGMQGDDEGPSVRDRRLLIYAMYVCMYVCMCVLQSSVSR